MVTAEEGRRKHPAVSVIIPTHNYGRYLRDAISSVQAQTSEDWECLVVDDGSTDETAELLERLTMEEPRLVHIAQTRRGPSAARNAGLLRARGEFIQFLDADDLLHPTKLESHVQALGAMGDVDVVHGPTRYFDDETPAVLKTAIRGPDGPAPRPLSGHGPEVLEHLLVANSMTIEAALVRRSVFDVVGVFDERLRRMEDWEFWLRCATSGMHFAFVPSVEPVALVRLHGASVSRHQTAMLLAEIPIRVHLQRLLPDATARDLNRRRMDEVRAEAGVGLSLDGEARHALRLLLPAALSQRRIAWLAWAVATPIGVLPRGQQLLRVIHSRRHRMRRVSR